MSSHFIQNIFSKIFSTFLSVLRGEKHNTASIKKTPTQLIFKAIAINMLIAALCGGLYNYCIKTMKANFNQTARLSLSTRRNHFTRKQYLTPHHSNTHTASTKTSFSKCLAEKNCQKKKRKTGNINKRHIYYHAL